jgi:hypothetical protein
VRSFEPLNPGTSDRKALVAKVSPRLPTKVRGATTRGIEIENLADEKNFYVFKKKTNGAQRPPEKALA